MRPTKGKCQVVVGAQWGDEGKGKIVDVLSARADVVARYQGGANAGHTIVVGDDEFVFHQIPSGILYPGVTCLLGNGVVLEPGPFFEELDALEARGVDISDRVWVSDRAHIILPYHRALDTAAESARGAGAIGTTGRGIGPAYEDKVARCGVRVADLDDIGRLRSRVETNVEDKREALSRAGGDVDIDVDSVLTEIESWRRRLGKLSTDVSLRIDEALRDGRTVLLEGAQGSQLDIDHGTYPFVTSSNTTAAGAAVGVGIGPRRLDAVIGVVKAYTTRVGNGPLPTEVAEPLQTRFREAGGEYGATTGRPRRCGWFDAVVARHARRVNGLSELAITKLDVLDGFESIEICTLYRDPEGREYETVPADTGLLDRCEPLYETMPGWAEPTSDATSWPDLPAAARAYIERLETLVGVPVTRVSVGQGREQILER